MKPSIQIIELIVAKKLEVLENRKLLELMNHKWWLWSNLKFPTKLLAHITLFAMNLLFRAIELSKINKTCNSQDSNKVLKTFYKIWINSVACLYSMLYPPLNKLFYHFMISYRSLLLVFYEWMFNFCFTSLEKKTMYVSEPLM